ncbi:hypothetical protein L596_028808 [Steinernema carpocapsae]|uniref:Uncharacterized protein n=1 Tax=Steinernema carpocapsae TaxID=34508 RepID=A0A4U5LZE6_STECR|nr:hypothetical protein L596_028808 [Steinernema carpocapsae]
MQPGNGNDIVCSQSFPFRKPASQESEVSHNHNQHSHLPNSSTLERSCLDKTVWNCNSDASFEIALSTSIKSRARNCEPENSTTRVFEHDLFAQTLHNETFKTQTMRPFCLSALDYDYEACWSQAVARLASKGCAMQVDIEAFPLQSFTATLDPDEPTQKKAKTTTTNLKLPDREMSKE